MKEHNCFICIRYDYDDTGLLTLNALKEHIKWKKHLKDLNFDVEVYSLSQYADKRYSTDIMQFNYCPMCGEKINWKAIKEQQQ